MNVRRLFLVAALLGAAAMLFLPGCSNPFNTASVDTEQAGIQAAEGSRGWTGGDLEHPDPDQGKMYWQCWHNDKGTTDYTNIAPGQYSVRWNNNGQSDMNFVGGQGWNPGHESRTIVYEGTFNPNGNGYLAFYGWTYEWESGEGSKKVQQVEYYVVESYSTYNPGSGATRRGSVTSDGATYDIYYKRQINQPSLDGNQDFDQFFSVRNPKKPTGNISGTITLYNHMAAWKKLGMNQSSVWDYHILATEGYGSSGSANLKVRQIPPVSVRPPGMPGYVQTPSGYPETRIALKARYNDRYLCADLNRGSNAPLYADRTAIGAWERYYMVHLLGNKVALRAESTGKYVSAENGGASQAVANRTMIDEWEIFDLEKVSGITNGVKFKNNVTKATSDGKYSGWYLRFDGRMQQYHGTGCIFYLQNL